MDSAILFDFTLLYFTLHLSASIPQKNLYLYHNKHSLIFFTIIIYFYFFIFLHVSTSILQNVQNKSVYKIIIARVIQYIHEFKINLNE